MGLNPLRLFKLTIPQKPLGGRYKVISQLGSGGFGQTFLAADLHLPGQPQCVIKQLKPQISDSASLQTARRLFDTEARVLYELGNHDQIPRLLAHFEDDQEFYLAQELIDGNPLAQELELGQPWPQAKVIALLQDLLNVLSFVHRQQVIHRDIKPSNLIRRRHDGKIVLIDFGAVKEASTQVASPETGITRTISIGTQGYMPNEQMGGNPKFSSDIYAVGMIGIQALTGIHPRFLESDPQTSEIMWRHKVKQVHSGLADILDRMVRYDFRTRYVTAVEALAALGALPDELLMPPPVTEAASDEAGRAVSEAPNSLLPTNAEQWFNPSSSINSSASSRANIASAMSAEQGAPTAPLNEQSPTIDIRPARSPLQPQQPVRSTLPTRAVSAPRPHHRRRVDLQTVLQSPVSLGAIAASGVGAILIALLLFAPKSNQQTIANPPEPTNEATPNAEEAEFQAVLTSANQQREAENFQQALDAYNQAIALNPDRADAHWGRCYSLNRLQQAEEALKSCDRALELAPENPQFLWSKGHALEQLKQYNEALAIYNRVIELDPKFAAAWNNLGTTLLSLQRPQEAVEAFDQALQFDPQLAEAWNNRGAALWNLRNFEAALNSVNRALELQPDYADARALQQEMRQRLNR
jgi:serine/threonine protein kinase